MQINRGIAIFFIKVSEVNKSRVSNVEYDNSQNVGLEDYNNISVGIFPYFTTPSIKIKDNPRVEGMGYAQLPKVG